MIFCIHHVPSVHQLSIMLTAILALLFFYLTFMVLDDSWLQISPEDLDKLLFKTSGLDPADMAKAGADLSKMGDGMKAFVKKKSGVSGAEFPKYVMQSSKLNETHGLDLHNFYCIM